MLTNNAQVLQYLSSQTLRDDTLPLPLTPTPNQVLQYLWSQTLRDDTHSKLLVGLDRNPAIVST